MRQKINTGSSYSVLTGKCAALGSIAIVIVFYLNYTYILNHFYGNGAFLYDSGWIAGLIHSKDLLLHSPSSVGNETSYYTVHFTPLLGLISLVSFFVPVGMVTWFASFHASIFSLLSAAAWLLAGDQCRRSGWPAIVVASLLAVLFGLNGIALGQVCYPHYEFIGPSFICLAIALYCTKWRRLGFICLVLGVLSREDAGLHAATLFGLLWGYETLTGRSTGLLPRRVLGQFTIISLLAGIGCMLCQKLFFPGSGIFSQSFLGDPVYGHVNASFLATRTLALLTTTLNVVLPFLLAGITTIVLREPVFLLGFVAFIPWLLLNFLGPRDAPGALQLYYAFPFALSLFVAMAAALHSLRLQQLSGPAGRLAPLLLALAFPLISIIGFGASPLISLPHVLSDMSSLKPFDAPCLESFLTELVAEKPRLGRLVVDDSIAALRPFDFRPEETLSNVKTSIPDLLVFFPSGYEMDAVMRVIHTSTTRQFYGFRCANLGLVAFRPLPPDSALPRWLVPLDANLQPLAQ